MTIYDSQWKPLSQALQEAQSFLQMVGAVLPSTASSHAPSPGDVNYQRIVAMYIRRVVAGEMRPQEAMNALRQDFGGYIPPFPAETSQTHIPPEWEEQVVVPAHNFLAGVHEATLPQEMTRMQFEYQLVLLLQRVIQGRLSPEEALSQLASPPNDAARVRVPYASPDDDEDAIDTQPDAHRVIIAQRASAEADLGKLQAPKQRVVTYDGNGGATSEIIGTDKGAD